MAFQFNFAVDADGENLLNAFSEVDVGEMSTVRDIKEDTSKCRNISPGKCDMKQNLLHINKDEPEFSTFDHVDESKNLAPTDKQAFSNVAREHCIPEDVSRVLENKVVESLPALQFVNISVVESIASNSGDHAEDIVSRTISSHSDLISGIYEGGLKIWECTFDLMGYLDDSGIELVDKSVLDLGCGAGLLGVVALKLKASPVHFQDYNSTVIDEVTLPNVVVNCVRDAEEGNLIDSNEPGLKRCKKSQANHGKLSSCRFFSGEWSQFTQLLQNEIPPAKYDLILTSETIYNPDYYCALHDALSNLLRDNGLVLLASKAHYFGVGGGVLLFEEFVKERNVFKIRTVKLIDEGLQRVILELSFKNAC
ncbi:histidine protein methyltransferase 1 homolog [Ambystoma mexicanum]|uniref:histidine protein methyltransferase 1 homolog n=1 Tax=Ambystoma mexicanum TaxID=8296 RepID=UPI0037E7F274